MEEAMARAAEQDTYAQRQLVRTSQDAVSTGAESMSQVGSYSDYLKAKRDAKNAWAAVTQSTGDVRLDALRGSMSQRPEGMAKAAGDELANREQALGGRVGEAYQGAQQNRARQAAWTAAQEQAKSEREKADRAAKQDYFQSAWGRVLGQHRNWDPNITATEQAQRMQQLSRALDSGEWTPDAESSKIPGGTAGMKNWLGLWSRDYLK